MHSALLSLKHPVYHLFPTLAGLLCSIPGHICLTTATCSVEGSGHFFFFGLPLHHMRFYAFAALD